MEFHASEASGSRSLGDGTRRRSKRSPVLRTGRFVSFQRSDGGRFGELLESHGRLQLSCFRKRISPFRQIASARFYSIDRF